MHVHLSPHTNKYTLSPRCDAFWVKDWNFGNDGKRWYRWIEDKHHVIVWLEVFVEGYVLRREERMWFRLIHFGQSVTYRSQIFEVETCKWFLSSKYSLWEKSVIHDDSKSHQKILILYAILSRIRKLRELQLRVANLQNSANWFVGAGIAILQIRKLPTEAANELMKMRKRGGLKVLQPLYVSECYLTGRYKVGRIIGGENWCCCSYLIKNSPVALLEALFARIFLRSSWGQACHDLFLFSINAYARTRHTHKRVWAERTEFKLTRVFYFRLTRLCCSVSSSCYSSCALIIHMCLRVCAHIIACVTDDV